MKSYPDKLRLEPIEVGVGLAVGWKREVKDDPTFWASATGRIEAGGAVSLRWEHQDKVQILVECQKLELGVSSLRCLLDVSRQLDTSLELLKEVQARERSVVSRGCVKSPEG